MGSSKSVVKTIMKYETLVRYKYVISILILVIRNQTLVLPDSPANLSTT